MLQSKVLTAESQHQLTPASAGAPSLERYSVPTDFMTITRVESTQPDASYQIHETQAQTPDSPPPYTVHTNSTQQDVDMRPSQFQHTPDVNPTAAPLTGMIPGTLATVTDQYSSGQRPPDPYFSSWMFEALMTAINGVGARVDGVSTDVQKVQLTADAAAQSVEQLRRDTANGFQTHGVDLRRIDTELKAVQSMAELNAVAIQQITEDKVSAEQHMEQRLEVLDRANRKQVENDVMLTIPKSLGPEQRQQKATEMGQLTEVQVADMLGVQAGTGCRILEKKAPKLVTGRQPQWRHGDACDRIRVWVQDKTVVESIAGKKANRQTFTRATGYQAQRQLTDLELSNKSFLQTHVMSLMHGALNRKAWWTRGVVTWFVESKDNFANLSRSDLPLVVTEDIIRTAVAAIEAKLTDNTAFANVAGPSAAATLPAVPIVATAAVVPPLAPAAVVPTQAPMPQDQLMRPA